ncbi:hypothetical protein L1D26_13370 [Vibrio mediterranei]|uniref:hypothetical protein n=1 Tax=Vibrio mediterranei TaxID=689 RepID=UPI001EFCE1A1|nr:hypothetical protein [Vibrio mediterranei]MCG9664067.1 hypothetical protein [Vibrio mediterranei]
MLAKSVSTIYSLLAILVILVLSSGAVRADVSSPQSTLSMAQVMHVKFCGITSDTLQTEDSGCCEPGGTCFEKQCCSHGHASGSALVETPQDSRLAPYRYELTQRLASLYTSADMHSLYRPPIA